MIGFAFMIPALIMSWAGHEMGPGASSLQRGRRLQWWKLCSAAALCPVSEITHQNNQTFTNSPPTANYSNQRSIRCVPVKLWCVKLMLSFVSTCVNISGIVVNKSIKICSKDLHCLQFINDINVMDYLSHPGRPSRALSGSQLSAGACCRWREPALSWEMLISGAFCRRLAPAPLHYICHFCCSSKWTLNHPRTWEKYFTTLCCIFQIKDSWWTHNISLKSTASLNVIIRSRPTNVCRLRASLNFFDSKNALIISWIMLTCMKPSD